MMRLVLIAALACAGGLTPCLHAQKTDARTLPATQVGPALKGLWDQSISKYDPALPLGKRREWQMKLTTWLPSEWPPTERTIWTQYAYGLDVTLDGVAGVSAPFARVERHAGEDSDRVLIPMNRKVKSIANHPVRPHGGWRYSAEDEAAVLNQVLDLNAAPADTKKIAAYFQSWRLGSAEIAAQVAPRHRAFFAWLDQQ